MAEFTGTIEVGYYTDYWGPYFLTFSINSTATANDGMLPYGSTITSANVKAYLGSVKRSSTLTDFTEITSDLIETSEVSGDNVVKFWLQHPGSTYKGEKATLIIELTLSTTGPPKKAFYFQYVRIR